MRGWLFGVFLLTLFVAVALTTLGLLANWGIWITSPLVEQGKELPLLKMMVTGVILGVVGLLIELGRRWFIIKNVRDELLEAYVRLIGAAVVLPTTEPEQSKSNYTYVSDFIKGQIRLPSIEVRNVISKNVEAAVQDMMGVRYGGATRPSPVSEVLPQQASNQ